MKLILSRRNTIALLKENRVGFLLWIVFFFVLFIEIPLNGYLLFSQSIRLDESQSLWAATRSISGVLDYVSLDVSTPLYLVLLHFWMQFFGQTIFTARLLSFIFFLMTLPVLYILAKESSNRRVAILTIVLFSLSPFIMWYSSEARTYTLFAFVTSLNHVFFLRLIRTKGEVGKTGYVLSSIMGLYTHYFFLLIVVTQQLFMLVRWCYTAYTNQAQKLGNIIKRMYVYKDFPLVMITLFLLSFLFFEPWLIYFFLQGSASNTRPLIPRPTAFNIFQTFVNFLFGFQSTPIQTVLISLWPLAIIFLFFTFTQKRHTEIDNVGYFTLATFLPIFLDFFGSYVKPIFLSRYLILATPTMFFLLAWLLLNNARKLSLTVTSALIIAMFALQLYQNISIDTPVKENYQEVSQYLGEHVSPQDIIVVSAPFTIYPIEYTYNGSVKIDTIPLWDQYAYGPIPTFSIKNLSQQINGYAKNYRKMFLVLSYDQGYQSAIIHYLDGHYKRNAMKVFSPGLQVRIYQLRYN